MFSAEQVREMSAEVDRQLGAARGMSIADEKDAIVSTCDRIASDFAGRNPSHFTSDFWRVARGSVASKVQSLCGGSAAD